LLLINDQEKQEEMLSEFRHYQIEEENTFTQL